MIDESNSEQSNDDRIVGRERAVNLPLNRREVLGSVLSCMVPLTSGVGTAQEGSSEVYVDESTMTERLVDVADGEEVSGIIDDVSSGELLVFPSGTFTWSWSAEVYADDWGIRCQPDTVFEIPAGRGDGGSGLLLRTVAGNNVADNFLLENLTFDSPGRAAPGLQLGVRNSAHVDGLHYRMNGPASHREQQNGITARVTTEEGVLRIDDYWQSNNGDLGAYASGDSRVGIFVGSGHRGTVHLVNPVLEGFPNNACYVSRQYGTVIIEGGLLANNNVSAVRVSGGVEVRDTTILIDTDHYADGDGSLDGSAHNTRGVWGDNRDRGDPGGLVSGVSFVLQNYRNSQGLADILENPSMTLENCQFLLNADIEAISADDGGEIEVSGCTFDGSSTGSTAGVGDVTGSGNHLNPEIDPGAVPVASTSDYAFDWSRTHPETPGRPESVEGSRSTLAIGTADDTDWMNYSFTATGEILKDRFAGDDDSITQNADGTWTASGVVGKGGADSYEVDGEIVTWSAESDPSAYTLLLDGSEVSPGMLREGYEHTLEIVIGSDASDPMNYSFTTSGPLARGDYAGEDDTVGKNDDGTWTAAGVAGNGTVDSYEFDGEVRSWSAEFDRDEYALFLDGSPITVEELTTD